MLLHFRYFFNLIFILFITIGINFSQEIEIDYSKLLVENPIEIPNKFSELKEINFHKNGTVQDATQVLLQSSVILRKLIVNIFGQLLYNHYDDFTINQVEIMYRIFNGLLIRKYNILRILPELLNDTNVTPAQVCSHLYKKIEKITEKYDFYVCMNINYVTEHLDDTKIPELKNSNDVLHSEVFFKYYPKGLSLPLILNYLKKNVIQLTPGIASGLIQNVNFDKYNHKTQVYEQKAVTTLKNNFNNFDILIPVEMIREFKTIEELIENILWSNLNNDKVAEYLTENLAREIITIDPNIELFGNIYENGSINLKNLFELILPNDALDIDVVAARDFLLNLLLKEEEKLENFLQNGIQKYEHKEPDQLLLQILNQLIIGNFVPSISKCLYIHTTYWQKTEMIQDVEDLLNLFDAYENLKYLSTFNKLNNLIFEIKQSLTAFKNVPIEILCTMPRGCLKIGLNVIKECNQVDMNTKKLINEFLIEVKCTCSVEKNFQTNDNGQTKIIQNKTQLELGETTSSGVQIVTNFEEKNSSTSIEYNLENSEEKKLKVAQENNCTEEGTCDESRLNSFDKQMTTVEGVLNDSFSTEGSIKSEITFMAENYLKISDKNTTNTVFLGVSTTFMPSINSSDSDTNFEVTNEVKTTEKNRKNINLNTTDVNKDIADAILNNNKVLNINEEDSNKSLTISDENYNISDIIYNADDVNAVTKNSNLNTLSEKNTDPDSLIFDTSKNKNIVDIESNVTDNILNAKLNISDTNSSVTDLNINELDTSTIASLLELSSVSEQLNTETNFITSSVLNPSEDTSTINSSNSINNGGSNSTTTTTTTSELFTKRTKDVTELNITCIENECKNTEKMSENSNCEENGECTNIFSSSTSSSSSSSSSSKKKEDSKEEKDKNKEECIGENCSVIPFNPDVNEDNKIYPFNDESSSKPRSNLKLICHHLDPQYKRRRDRLDKIRKISTTTKHYDNPVILSNESIKLLNNGSMNLDGTKKPNRHRNNINLVSDQVKKPSSSFSYPSYYRNKVVRRLADLKDTLQSTSSQVNSRVMDKLLSSSFEAKQVKDHEGTNKDVELLKRSKKDYTPGYSQQFYTINKSPTTQSIFSFNDTQDENENLPVRKQNKKKLNKNRRKHLKTLAINSNHESSDSNYDLNSNEDAIANRLFDINIGTVFKHDTNINQNITKTRNFDFIHQIFNRNQYQYNDIGLLGIRKK